MTSASVDLAWPDSHGRLRSAVVPVDEVDAFVAGFEIDPAELDWPGVAGPLRLSPDGSAAFTPAGGRPVRLCSLLGPDGEPSPACSRSVLGRMLAAAADAGFEVVAAAEIELFLTGPDGRPVYEDINHYALVRGARFERVMRAVRGLTAAGIPVIATNTEYGGGQFEVNLRHGPALAAIDAVCLAKGAIAAAAADAGYGATFAAKPWPDQSGSGLHLHQSLWRDGRNAFWEEGGLSPLGRAYLAGLLDGMEELSPLGTPTALGYTRRSDLSFCPVNVSWGGDNRTVAIRALAEAESTTRLEQRDAASDGNPYLALAGQIGAGLRGIERGLEPPAPTTGNAYGRRDLRRLPRTLAEALDYFEASELAVTVLGPDAHAGLVEALRPAADAALAGLAVPDPDGAW